MDHPHLKTSADKARQDRKYGDRMEGVKRIFMRGKLELETPLDPLRCGVRVHGVAGKDFGALGEDLGVPTLVQR